MTLSLLVLCPAGVLALIPCPHSCLSSPSPYVDSLFLSALDYFQRELRCPHVARGVCSASPSCAPCTEPLSSQARLGWGECSSLSTWSSSLPTLCCCPWWDLQLPLQEARARQPPLPSPAAPTRLLSTCHPHSPWKQGVRGHPCPLCCSQTLEGLAWSPVLPAPDALARWTPLRLQLAPTSHPDPAVLLSSPATITS